MKKSLVILCAAALGLGACNNYKDAPGGTKYIIHKSEGKEKIKVGDIVKLNFIRKSEKDSIMSSTYDVEQPQIFPVAEKMYAGDMNDILTMFGEGDSATFKLNLDTMATRSGQPKPPGTPCSKYERIKSSARSRHTENTASILVRPTVPSSPSSLFPKEYRRIRSVMEIADSRIVAQIIERLVRNTKSFRYKAIR